MSQGLLRAALADYLSVRRSLGFKLARDGLLLEQFVAFCEQAGAELVTSQLAMAWVTAPGNCSPAWAGMRLSIVRGFARWLQAADPATEVPPTGWLPPRHRTVPYLYSEADIAALLEVARRARWPLSAATYETMIGLLAVTGMFSRDPDVWLASGEAYLCFSGCPWGDVDQPNTCGARSTARHRLARGTLSWVMSSRLAARAASSSWPRSSSCRRRSATCCSRVTTRWSSW